MNKKKPAQLSDDLLLHRPRKGNARAQSEPEANHEKNITSQTRLKPSRRRGRRSQNTAQLNMKLSPEIMERFTKLADDHDLIFCDTLSMLLDNFETKNLDN